MPRTGRPSELTPQLTAEVVKLLERGNYICAVADMEGIDRTTFARWRRRGRKEEKRLASDPDAQVRESERAYLEFHHAVKKALASAEIYDLALIRRAAAGHPRRVVTRRRTLPDGTVEETTDVTEGITPQWQASAWRLERKHFDRWGRKQRSEVTGKDGKDLISLNAIRALFDDDDDDTQENDHE